MSIISRRLLIIFLLSFSVSPCFAQSNTFVQDSNGLFKRGLFLENKNILIPWGVYFNKIREYGGPKVVQLTRRRAYAQWDSVSVLGGKLVNFICLYTRGVLSKGILKRKYEGVVKELYVEIDSADFRDFKALLTKYSGVEGKYTDYKKYKDYYWFVDGCNVKFRAFSNKHFYLMMQKIVPIRI